VLDNSSLPEKDLQDGRLAAARIEPLRVACLMMQKNERDLVGPWLEYHGNLFGFENLFVFDNGSDDIKVLGTLKEYEDKGVKVNYSYSTRGDFEKKGDIISAKIKSLDKLSPFDFYFPTDCDEFIVTYTEGGQVAWDRAAFSRSLLPFRNEKKVIEVGASLFNNPERNNEFMLLRRPKKCFFAQDACEFLDVGFHLGRSVEGDATVLSSIAHLHFHNRPYNVYRYFASQKMAHRLKSSSRSYVEEYVRERQAGAHIASRLLLSKEDYNDGFSRGKNSPFPVHAEVVVPEFLDFLKQLGAPLEFNSDGFYDQDIGSLIFEDARGPSDAERWTVPSRKPSDGGIRGHVDAVRIEGERVFISGWAIDRWGLPAPMVLMTLGNVIVPARKFVRTPRPDVSAVHEDADALCGFSIEAQVVIAPSQKDALLVVAHDPRNGVSTILPRR
jgi:hypothetical protein